MYTKKMTLQMSDSSFKISASKLSLVVLLEVFLEEAMVKSDWYE